MAIVLDCSLALAWGLPDGTSVIGIFLPESTALEDYLLAVGVVAEPEAAEGEAVLALAGGDCGELPNVVPAAHV